MFLLFLTGLASLASSVLHLLLRDRRRGDIVMLVLVLIIPILAIAPQFFFQERRADGGETDARRAAGAAADADRARRAAAAAVCPVGDVLPRGEERAPPGGRRSAARRASRIAALGVQLAGYAAYRRVLDMPANQGTRRAGSFGGLWNRVIPGLSPARVRRRVRAAASRAADHRAGARRSARRC